MSPFSSNESLKDLSERWCRARRAALRAVVARAAGDDAEDHLLAQALAIDRDSTLRHVFENSLKLGTGFSRFFHTEPALEDLPAVLTQLLTPCASGTWTVLPEREPALRLERAGCPAATHGAAACDYWREAISGLVLGMSGLLHARHASMGHKDPSCIDVFFLTTESEHRFGPIPDEMRATLEGAVRLVKRFDSRVEIEFLGIAEGILYYREKRGSGEVSTASQLKSAVQRRFPDLSLRELSPRPVLAGENPW